MENTYLDAASSCFPLDSISEIIEFLDVWYFGGPVHLGKGDVELQTVLTSDQAELRLTYFSWRNYYDPLR